MSTSQIKNGLALAAQRCSVGEMECECDSDTFQVLKAGDDERDPKVIYQLGMRYHYGWGTAKDLKAAVECYGRAAGIGSFEALERLYDLRNESEDDSSSESDTDSDYSYESSCNDDSIDKLNSLILINLQSASRGFCEKADQGDIRAQFNAGYCYYWGIITPEDRAKARDLFQMAADQGCADAMWGLEICRVEGFGDGYNGMQGIKLLKHAAELGSVEAQFELGFAYFRGETTYDLKVKQDHKQAVEWFEKAVDQNHTKATYYLAYCYYLGEGVQKDIKKAFILFKKAALMGHGEAQDRISDFYRHEYFNLPEDEWPVGIDYYEAVYWNWKAVEQDNYSAKESMPDMLKSIGLTQNEIDELIKQTSSFESAKTWYEIAKEYETGDGVERDEKKAFKMYKLAARFGSIPAKVALGRCYKSRIGVKKDLKEAIHWYEKAAMEGNHEAAAYLLNLIQQVPVDMALKEGSPFIALAECYETGSGVSMNEDISLLMREHAAANGDIQQAKAVIEAYISGNGNEYRIKTVGSIVAKTPGLSREDEQQFIDKFENIIDELDKLWILEYIAAAIRAESMGINIVFE